MPSLSSVASNDRMLFPYARVGRARGTTRGTRISLGPKRTGLAPTRRSDLSPSIQMSTSQGIDACIKKVIEIWSVRARSIFHLQN